MFDNFIHQRSRNLNWPNCHWRYLRIEVGRCWNLWWKLVFWPRCKQGCSDLGNV
jgi:hypothetical protein